MNKISSIPILVLISLLASCKISESMAWVISTFAGTGSAGHAEGIGSTALFNSPYGVAVDSRGNVYVADNGNHRIRKITPAGVVSTFAGTGSAGHADGTGTEAQFNLPYGVAVDSSGNVYVGDLDNHRIRKITPAGVVSTFAGTGSASHADGTGNTAQFSFPYGVAVDSSDNVYVADRGNHRIRKITPANRIEDRTVSTFAGTGSAGHAEGIGSTALFNSPSGVAVDSRGNVYVADANNHLIRKITPADRIEDRTVSTFAGTGSASHADGTGNTAQFNNPAGVAVDSSGNIYVADYGNNRIRKITPADRIEDRMVSTIAGTGSTEEFNQPRGVAVDSSGNVYVADTDNNRIRKIEYKVP